MRSCPCVPNLTNLSRFTAQLEEQVPEQLISPHGGALVDLIVTPDRAAELKEQSRNWPSWDLTPRQLCDLELLGQRRFLAPAGLPRRGGLRGRLRADAPGGRHALADPGHPRHHRRKRRPSSVAGAEPGAPGP